MTATTERVTSLTKEERAALNALALRGLHNAARCVERLLMDGETVLSVTIAGPGCRVDILPPVPTSPLWGAALTWRETAEAIGYTAPRLGTEIRWTITKDEAARRGINWRLH